ncbi:hypothetical protein [Rhizobium sp. BE258]|uniref:hypothetical protein n=1 Tax=Rhizobium sp. BE258 TaxID=2817722 RepID=UPI002859F736|nr:hypothetical protein [Rhizobium sp. BE258]MDR7145508.1 hypothetical protein [Rhizobium sp. BE258]
MLLNSPARILRLSAAASFGRLLAARTISETRLVVTIAYEEFVNPDARLRHLENLGDEG